MRQTLLQYANRKGLPIMSHEQFVTVTNEFGKEKFRLDLAQYIADERPPFPFKEITYEKMYKSFMALKKKKVADCLTPMDRLERPVFEKYDDYKYPFVKNGLGLIDAPSIHNDASNYFHQSHRLTCNSYGFKSPHHVWTEGTAKDIWRCLGPIWRGINQSQTLDERTYISAFRLQTYIATQFKPLAAKCIYQMTNAKNVLDTSMGWGDRLAAFYASDATEFIGCDPNPNTFKNYLKQCVEYEKFLGCDNPSVVTDASKFRNIKDDFLSFTIKGNKTVRCVCNGAENILYGKDSVRINDNDINVAFTSPPYFSTERYNEGGALESMQSWKKFDEYEDWRDKFFLPVSKKCFSSLDRDNGHLLVNIMDPTIKKDRYHSCDELVDSMREHFVGQIGMRIMQRPQGRKVFSEEKLKEFMNMIYIENIWYFKTAATDLDLFRSVRGATLDAFFS